MFTSLCYTKAHSQLSLEEAWGIIEHVLSSSSFHFFSSSSYVDRYSGSSFQSQTRDYSDDENAFGREMGYYMPPEAGGLNEFNDV
jgi:hypothetical protein